MPGLLDGRSPLSIVCDLLKACLILWPDPAGITVQIVLPQRGWEYLRRLGYTPQVPRPQHAQANPESQDAFKKTAPH
jgi:hypothetical protein